MKKRCRKGESRIFIKDKKKGAVNWDFVVKILLYVGGVLVLALVIYFIISGDLFGLGNYIKNLFKFGV